ncbi:MAG: hypothetical protein KAG14_04885, partial [Mycoplasmataceae bacterium]|nr:hypothetical protein [Mycoplasmataceae bacterium]
GVISKGKLYLPNIGASPEPPVKFNVNVQALVHVIETYSNTERQDLHVNLNNQIKTETQPSNPTESLDRLFGNDLVAIDCDNRGHFCLIVSRGGNNVIRASINHDGSLNLNAPNVVRFQTGNIPTGVVIDRHAKRAYVNNEINVSVSVIDLSSNTVMAQDIPSGRPPVPGSFAHRALVGKLVFFTALGTPDNNMAGTDIRDIEPLAFRGKASDNGWSDCASCHPRGLADGVTWMFPTGPRQTIPLDAFYNSRSPAHHQRLSNWSAVRGSITDFNNNSRNIQGGIGFAGDPANENIFNHGITQGASEALDFETLWVQTIRPLNMPIDNSAHVAEGRLVFNDNCASCHGGGLWTKSQVFHKNNPTFDSNPLAGGQPLDPGIDNAGPQIKSYSDGFKTITFLEGVGTFDLANPLEIRGAGAKGKTALGGLGFNVPSLLDVDYHAPYFHDGSAQTLEQVMAAHLLPSGDAIATTLDAITQQNLIKFLKTIDARTQPLRSEGDDFRDFVAP